jgi:hypothetical protein
MLRLLTGGTGHGHADDDLSPPHRLGKQSQTHWSGAVPRVGILVLGHMRVQLGGKVIWAGLRGCGCSAGTAAVRPGPAVPFRLTVLVARLRGRRAAAGHPATGQGPEAARIRAALDMHELDVELYRQRMRREHPQVDGCELDALVRAWLAEPPRSGRLRLPSRERDRGIR